MSEYPGGDGSKRESEARCRYEMSLFINEYEALVVNRTHSKTLLAGETCLLDSLLVVSSDRYSG